VRRAARLLEALKSDERTDGHDSARRDVLEAYEEDQHNGVKLEGGTRIVPEGLI